MKLDARQLQGSIERGLNGLIWLSSEDPLLLQEAADLVRSSARSQGFNSRERYVVDNAFDWSSITNSADSLSLFSEKKLIDIQLNSKPNEQAKTALQRLASTADAETAILISSDKIDSKTSKAKWFKSIEENITWVPIWPLRANEIQPWIKSRLAQCGLSCPDDAAALIAERTEGNLLATAQEIDKLRLLIDGDRVSIEAVHDSVAVSSRYNVFDLGDKLLAGQHTHAIRALQGLRGEGAEPSIILWAIAKDLRLLIAVKKLANQGQDSDKALMSLGIFKMRQSLLRKSAQRLSPGRLKRALELCQQADEQIKTSNNGDVWHTLEHACLIMLGTDAPHLASLV